HVVLDPRVRGRKVAECKDGAAVGSRSAMHDIPGDSADIQGYLAGFAVDGAAPRRAVRARRAVELEIAVVRVIQRANDVHAAAPGVAVRRRSVVALYVAGVGGEVAVHIGAAANGIGTDGGRRGGIVTERALVLQGHVLQGQIALDEHASA